VLNLLLHDAKGQMPKEPQSVAAHLDGSLQKNVLNLRDASLQLTPTARASNWVSLSGKLNLANPSAVSGSLALKADALDATYYYRLYASRPAAPPPPATTSSSSVPAANVEPDPVILPLTNFNFTADIRSFYLEEIAVSNIAAQLKVDGGKVELPKLQAVINGAPLAGKLAANLGVPGYVYDLDFNLQRLPLQPVVASFMPQAKDGVRGDMTLALAVKGAGTTGRNLKQTLSGGMVMDVTNAAVVVKSLIQPKRTGNVSPGNQFLIVLTGVLDPVLNSVGQAVGIPNLTSEPFNTSRMEMKFGAGNLTLADFTLANRKIFVGSQGRIPIADDLMQSPLDLPVQIALSRELAQRFNIANAPTNATHVKLPDFVLVKGTLEKPETKLNTKALTGTALQQIGKQVGGDAGGVLQGLGNLLGGGTKAITNAPPSQANSPATSSTTNKPPTNAPVNNLINDLFKPKPRQ
jgi:tetrahydromethanopterin S-methyltransferase subunit G